MPLKSIQSILAGREKQERSSFILWGVIVVATFALLLFDNALRIAWAFKMPVLMNDFQVFYKAAGQADPYEVVKHIDRLHYRPFLSPPTLLPWLSWLSFIPFNLAWALWGLLSVTCYGLAAKAFTGFPRDILALVSFGTIEAIIAGQVTLFLGAALMFGFLHMKTRPILSGVIFGIVATIKPQVLLALPVALVASREWQTLTAAFLTGFVLGAASVLTQGLAIWFKWLAVIQQFALWVPTSDFHYFGLTPNNLAAFLRLGPQLSQIVGFLGICLGIWTAWQVFRKSEDPGLRLGAVIVGYLLCSRYALVYEMALIAPVAAVWLLDRKAMPICWISGGLALACSTGQFTYLHLGVFAPPLLAIALLKQSRNAGTSQSANRDSANA